jgi:type-F conjugative transfer system mating-pair stabilization protein TraN
MILLMTTYVKAGDRTSYAQGTALAAEKSKNPEKLDVKDVPVYQDPTVFAGSITEGNIDAKAQNASITSSEAKDLRESHIKRPRFDLKATDPLFVDADTIVTNPEKSLSLKAQTKVLPVGKTQHICTKGYDLSERKCLWTKVAKQTGVRKEAKQYKVTVSAVEAAQKGGICVRHLGNLAMQADPVRYARFLKSKAFKAVTPAEAVPAFKAIFHGRDELTKAVVAMEVANITAVKVLRHFGSLIEIKTGRVASGFGTEANTHQYYEVEVHTFKEIPIYILEDKNNCDDLEGKADTGACEYSYKKCVEGEQTRIVNGTPIHAKCWAEEAVYQCRTSETDECNQWVKKGCVQVGSKCLTYLEKGHCIKWQQTYECSSGKRQLPIMTLTGEKPFCLDGNCIDQTWNGNGDMVEALSKLAIFKEMQKGLDAKAGIVFKGRSLGCSRVPAGFKDCCKIKGWGQDIKLASCSPEEKDLVTQRKLNKCLMIGTYCADKVLGVCTRKKTTYCCYPSKLSKIINVQGKKQLGMSFGNAEHPECGGLTLDEINRIDFSKLDLTELFSEIFEKFTTPNTGVLASDIQKSMTNKTYMITDSQKKITQGKAHGKF